MAVYTLTGTTGIQALTAGTTQLFVRIQAPGSLMQWGRAYPMNRYDVALLRPGNSDYFYPATAVDADQQVIDLPSGITQLGYSLIAGTVLVVSENSPPPPAGLLLTSNVSGGTAHFGDTVTLTFTGLTTPTVTDWLVIVPAGLPYTSSEAIFGTAGYVYTSSCSPTAGTTPAGSGSCSAVLTNNGSGPGGMAVAWLANDTETVIATAANIDVLS